MLLQRRLEPKPFHALFFPQRKERAVCIGTAEQVWLWSREEFKHIDLSDFDLVIGLSDAQNNSPARTSDNLPCAVKATFWLRPRTDPESLQAATLKFAASMDLRSICGMEYFKNTIRAELRAVVQKAVAAVSFVDLLVDSSAGKRVETSLQASCADLIKKHGFELLSFDTQIDVIKPSETAFNDALRAQWNEYQQRKARLAEDEMRRASDAKVVEEQLKIEGAAKLAAQTAKSALETQKATDAHKEELDKLVTTQKTFELDQARERDRISALLAAVNDSAHRRDIQYKLELSKFKDGGEIANERELNKTKHANKLVELEEAAKVAELQGQDEERKRKELEAKRLHDIEMARLSAELAKMESTGATARAEVIEKVGLAEAHVRREHELALHSGEIASQEALLKALPDVLAKSSAPAERMAEIRYLHLGGATDQGSSAIGSSILGAVSTLPLLKEVLAFVRDWDATSRHAAGPAKAGSAEEHRKAGS